jgi:hypothetical protein
MELRYRKIRFQYNACKLYTYSIRDTLLRTYCSYDTSCTLLCFSNVYSTAYVNSELYLTLITTSTCAHTTGVYSQPLLLKQLSTVITTTTSMMSGMKERYLEVTIKGLVSRDGVSTKTIDV